MFGLKILPLEGSGVLPPKRLSSQRKKYLGIDLDLEDGPGSYLDTQIEYMWNNGLIT